MRYCVISKPRSGSTALLQGLFYGLLKNHNEVINVGDLHHPDFAMFHKSSETHMETRKPYNSIEHKEFRDKVTNAIENTNLPIVSKFHPSLWNYDYIDVLDFPKYLLKHGFKLIQINRNFMDSAISVIVATHTNYWHRHKGLPKNNFEPITLDLKFCLKILVDLQVYHMLANIIAKKYDCIVLNYENLFEETMLLPVAWDEINVYKTHDKPYNEIIKNYDEVCCWIKEFRNENA